jgi:hypothetical protein
VLGFAGKGTQRGKRTWLCSSPAKSPKKTWAACVGRQRLSAVAQSSPRERREGDSARDGGPRLAAAGVQLGMQAKQVGMQAKQGRLGLQAAGNRSPLDTASTVGIPAQSSLDTGSPVAVGLVRLQED